MSYLARHRTICAVLQEIQEASQEGSIIRDLVAEAFTYARSMDAKLTEMRYEDRERSISEMLKTLKYTVFQMRDGPIYPRDAVFTLMKNTISNAEAIGIKENTNGKDG